MREEIALLLYRIAGYSEDFETTFPNKAWHNLSDKARDTWYRKADQLLTLIRTKLKFEGLSDEEISGVINFYGSNETLNRLVKEIANFIAQAQRDSCIKQMEEMLK